MVLFPAFAKDSVASTLRAMITRGGGVSQWLLIGAVGVSFALPLVALWLLLKDLTRFYFAGNHFEAAESVAFIPRFSLSGLRVASDELDDVTRQAIADARRDPKLGAVLLPDNEVSRRRIDAKASVYGLTPGEVDDEARRRALMELATTRDRTLAQQAAGVELVLARHVLHVQLLVLRYVKAILAMLTTSAAAFACSSILAGTDRVTGAQGASVSIIIAVWAPTVVLAVSSPVRWVTKISMARGASDRSIKDDRDFMLFEDIAARLAAAAWSLAVAAGVVGLADSSPTVRWWFAVGALATVGLFAVAMSHWDGRRSLPRLIGMHTR